MNRKNSSSCEVIWNGRGVSSVFDLCKTWLNSCLDQTWQKSKQTKTPPEKKQPVTASVVYNILLVLCCIKTCLWKAIQCLLAHSLAEMAETIRSSALFYLCILIRYFLKYWNWSICGLDVSGEKSSCLQGKPAFLIYKERREWGFFHLLA